MAARFDRGARFRPSAKPGGAGGGPPTGAAGGDLTGTYPNPTIGAGKVVAADMAVGAVDLSTTVAAGVLAAGRFPALTGDVTTPSGSLATTIANGAVDLSGAKATGILAAGRFPALTGDVTTASGALATTIANSAVTNAKSANMAAYTAKGNNASSAGAPLDLTAAQLEAIAASCGYIAADYGYKVMAFDPALCGNAATALTPGGTIFGTRIRIPYAITVTQIIVHVVTIGATLTSGQCFAALYQGNNLLQTTADQSGAWVSTGTKAMTITSQALTAGFADIAFFYNGTTGPSFARPASANIAVGNLALTTTAIRFFTADTGRTTTMPGTLAAKSAAPATLIWCALN